MTKMSLTHERGTGLEKACRLVSVFHFVEIV